MQTKPPNHSKYTPELHEQIVAFIRKGYPKGTTFRLVGLHADTGFEWLRYGREQPDRFPHYIKLAEDIEQAIAEVQAERVDLILNAAQADPRNRTAAAWYLERTDPGTWGRKDRVEIDASQPLIQLNQVVLSDAGTRDQARELLRHVSGLAALELTSPRELPSPPPQAPTKDE